MDNVVGLVKRDVLYDAANQKWYCTLQDGTVFSHVNRSVVYRKFLESRNEPEPEVKVKSPYAVVLDPPITPDYGEHHGLIGDGSPRTPKDPVSFPIPLRSADEPVMEDLGCFFAKTTFIAMLVVLVLGSLIYLYTQTNHCAF